MKLILKFIYRLGSSHVKGKKKKKNKKNKKKKKSPTNEVKIL